MQKTAQYTDRWWWCMYWRGMLIHLTCDRELQSTPHAGFASRTELNLHSEQHCAGLLVRAISHPCFTGQRPLPSRAWVGHPWPSTALCFLEWPSMWQLRDSAQLPTATLAPFQRVSGCTWWGSFAEAGGVRPTAAQVKLCWDRVGIKSQPEWVKLNQIDTFWNCAMLWVILDYLMVSLLVWGLVSHRIWESSLFVMYFGATCEDLPSQMLCAM